MKFIKKHEGERYTPPGHDVTVQSRKLFNPLNGCAKLDIHITTFAPGAGMVEEVHLSSDHVFYILSGILSVYQDGMFVGNLEAGESVLILAGESHEVRNDGDVDGVFVAITTK